jgi:hypothetical protein
LINLLVPNDIAFLKAMLIASQLREVCKDDRIERLEKLVAAFIRQPLVVNPFAVFRALAAYLNAFTSGMLVMLGADQHEMR